MNNNTTIVQRHVRFVGGPWDGESKMLPNTYGWTVAVASPITRNIADMNACCEVETYMYQLYIMNGVYYAFKEDRPFAQMLDELWDKYREL